MQRIWAHLAKTYFSLDVRSLALFRVTFAIALLCDLYLRARVLDVFYTNEGLLPNHTLLWAPPGPYLVSLFFSASHEREALLLMILCALCFVCLLIGYRTRLAQFASLIALVSMNSRLALFENGGDVVMANLAVWSLPLPLGARFSVDSVLGSLRLRDETSPEQLNRRPPLLAPERVYSLACFALLLQFVCIYFFNVVQKSGPTWLDGSAVHYTLHQDRLVRPLGVWMREHVPFDVLKALARGTIVTESTIALAIASPVLVNYTRAAALLLMAALHGSFELALDLGIFSIAMVSFTPLLLTTAHWQALYRRLSRRHRRRRVYVDEDCGFCIQCARLLARLDVFQRLQFASNADAAALPAGVSVELADTTILVLDLDSGRVHQRAAAFVAVSRSLPLAALFSWPLALPGLRLLADRAYDLVASHRREISVWLGYAACGIPLPGGAPAPLPAAPAARQLLWQRAKCVLREGYVVLFLVAAAGEALNANPAVPADWHFNRPDWMNALVQYPRAFQAWRMFAPHAPLQDFMIEVDALTADGRHVDPYNEIGSRVHGPGLREIPAYLHENQFFTAYSLFIWMPQYRPYLQAFREWILRYPERTGQPRDRIVRFTVYKLSDQSPPPGQTKPSGFTREAFLSYPP